MNSSQCAIFFFQAEDGIRAGRVTGVQTCALPISHFTPPVGAEPHEPKSVRIQFLATVAIETIATQETPVDMLVRVDTLGNQKPAWSAARPALGRFELRQKPTGAFHREMIHQVMAELARGIAEPTRET